MTELVRPTQVSTATELRRGWSMFCPGCRDVHAISDAWTFDGNREAPTFSPSILVNYGTIAGVAKVCHSFIVAGQWQFLGDCTHDLAGQTVPMVEWQTADR